MLPRLRCGEVRRDQAGHYREQDDEQSTDAIFRAGMLALTSALSRFDHHPEV
jgi:hypothetical protein